MTPAEGIKYLTEKAKIDPSMPVFILIGPDVYAPSALIAWSALVGAPINGKPASDESIIKSVTARQLAEEIRIWQEKNFLKTKIPD